MQRSYFSAPLSSISEESMAIRDVEFSNGGYRGFLPYATFGTWKKTALAKNRTSKIFILCTQ